MSGALAVAGVIAMVGVTAVPADAAEARPKTFVVETVPAVKNLVFRFAGREYPTDAGGRLRIVARNARAYAELSSPLSLLKHVRLVVATTADGSIFRVHRWYGGSIRGNGSARATLEMLVPTRFRLLDSHRKPWPLSRIESFTLKRHDGLLQSFPGTALRRPLLLQGTYVAPNGLGMLLTKDAQYRIQSVTVDGTNVVHRAQQAFYPRRSRTVAVRLLFYPLRVHARDRLFSLPLGSGIHLKFPNGRVRYFHFSRGATVNLPALPRGSYVVHVSAPAVTSAVPVALTKGQVATVSLFSYLDAAAGALLLIFLGLGLWIFGHRRLVTSAP